MNEKTYRRWLQENAISYVAVSKGPSDWAATDEATLVRRGSCPICIQCGGTPRGPSMPSGTRGPSCNPLGELSLVMRFH